MKGLGGFQLACRADDAAVVRRLRSAKRRPTKPLALMAPTLAVARSLVPQLLCLPMFAELTDGEVDRVGRAIRDFYGVA